jgi:membrane-bound serine protease (ClpP class)
VRRAAAGALLGLGTLGLIVPTGPAGAQGAETLPPVHVVVVDGEIDLGIAALLERAVREAEADGAAALVVRVDTPGGRLDAVLRMRDVLLGSRVPTVAFVDRDAFSAGALVAIAAEQLWLAPGAVIGAATPVQGDGSATDEKTISAVRAVFRATASERGRDPAVAEAMVDPAIVVEGLIGRGKLLTMDVAQATERGYADGIAVDLEALLVALDLDSNPRVDVEPALAERLVRVLTSGLVAGLLLTVGIWLLVGDVLGGGGVGLGAALGASSIGLFLFGHLLAGLAGIESVLLIVLGIILILVEVLVLPGVGIVGVSGVFALLGGATLAMVDRDVEIVPRAAFIAAFNVAGLAFLAAVGLLVGLLVLLGRGTRTESEGSTRLSRRGNRLVLSTDVGGAHGDGLVGAHGVALTDLRPAGAAEIDGARIDVVAEAGYLAAGSAIEVVVDEGYRRVVRVRRPSPVSDAPADAPAGDSPVDSRAGSAADPADL